MAERSPATRFARSALWGVARGLALIWLVPALLFNVDWTGGSGLAHNVAAVGMILGAALIIEVAMRHSDWVRSPVLIAIALVLIYSNTKQAVRTLSVASEATSEGREARMVAGSQLASQRSRLEERRAAQAKVAGEAAVATLETAVETLKVSEPQRWRQTKGCDPAAVTSSAEFCQRVAEARTRVTAAIERERIDGELAKLPSATAAAGEVVPKVADAYIANVIALAGELGLKLTERLVAAEEAMSRALGLELLAAFGPACWLIVMNAAAGAPAGVSRLRAMAKRPNRDDAPAETAKADWFDRWFADNLELHDGATVFSKELRATPGWPADQPGINENMIWARMKKTPGVKHDPNKGRPRYFGIRVRTRPTLATVDGTRV